MLTKSSDFDPGAPQDEPRPADREVGETCGDAELRRRSARGGEGAGESMQRGDEGVPEPNERDRGGQDPLRNNDRDDRRGRRRRVRGGQQAAKAATGSDRAKRQRNADQDRERGSEREGVHAHISARSFADASATASRRRSTPWLQAAQRSVFAILTRSMTSRFLEKSQYTVPRSVHMTIARSPPCTGTYARPSVVRMGTTSLR